MKRNTIRKLCDFRLNKQNDVTIQYSIRTLSSNAKWKRTNIEDYKCEWSFPIRTLLGKGRRNEVIEELRSNHKAIRPLVVTDSNVQNLPIIQVKHIYLLEI